mmetsp:Transcript_4960/g.7557  ORF Transcript_4960/g.7557 Transcript_4960/m.7557 type:complete len:200 (+) Transcript_4960:46-645(+)
MPILSAKIPPTAGPNAVPAANELIIGAIVRARFKGVDESAMDSVAAVLRRDTPIPVNVLHTMRCSNCVASPMPPTPQLIIKRLYTRYGFLPCFSTSTAAGRLANSLAKAKELTTTPNSPVVSPRVDTTYGIIGIMIPTDDPTSSIDAEIGIDLEISSSVASVVNLVLKTSLSTLFDRLFWLSAAFSNNFIAFFASSCAK